MSNFDHSFPLNFPLRNEQGISHKLINSIFHYIDIDPEPFKTETLLEALNQRITLSFCNSLDHYLKIIIDNTIERKELINTLIFSTPSVFSKKRTQNILNEKVLKGIIENNSSEDIKIWVPLCGSGFSVISLAVLLEDSLTKHHKTFKIYATDVNKEAILRASSCQIYNNQQQIPLTLINNYFNHNNNGWIIKPGLRKKILFAKIDILGPQIIQNIDLIYLTDNFEFIKPEYQDKLIEVFNQSLNTNGRILFNCPPKRLFPLIQTSPDYPELFEKKIIDKDTITHKLNTLEQPKGNKTKSELQILIDTDLNIKHLNEGTPNNVLIKNDHQHVKTIFNQNSCDLLFNTITNNSVKANGEQPLVLELIANAKKELFLISSICNGDLYLLKLLSKRTEKPIKNEPEPSKPNRILHNEADKNDYEAHISDDLSSLNEQMRSKIITLETNAQQQENILNHLEVGYLLLDNELRIEKINHQAINFFKLNENDFSKHVYDVIPQFENHLLIEQLLDVLRNNKTIQKEISWLDNRLFRLVFSPAMDSKINVFCYDISKHLKNEEIAYNQYNALLKFIDKSSCILYSRNFEKNLRIKCITHNVKLLTGHSSLEFTKDKDLWLNLIHPNDVDLLARGFELLAKYGHFEISYRLINDKNDCIWIHDEMQVVVSNGEQIVVGTWRDITAQKIRDIAYRESEKRYKSLFDNTSDLVLSININGEIEYGNAAFMATLGYPANKTTQLLIEDIVPQGYLESFKKIHQQAFIGKTTTEFETCFISPDNQPCYLKGHIYPYYTGSKVVAAQVIFKKNQEKSNTLDNTTLLENIINNNDDTVCALDKNLEYLAFNAAYFNLHKTLFGQEPKIGDKEKTPYYNHWIRALDGDKFSHVEEYIIDEKNRFFDIKYSPLKNNLGEIIGVLQNCREVTEQIKNQIALHQTLTRLQESNKELEHFTYIVTHDLRGPVINLKGLLEIFERKHFVNDENDYIYQRISSSTEQIHETLKDLSEIISIGQAKSKNVELIDFYDITSKIEELLNPQIIKSKAKIIKDFLGAPGINYQLAHLKSIFLNIISNAIKYKRKGVSPIIKIKSAIEDNYTCISFEDNGMGLDDSKKNEIFGMFQRLNEEIEGKGLGLYITKAQLESCGGKIEVTSRIGVGSTFKIYLKDQKT